MACVAVLSLMRTMELEFLQPQPRPILQQNQLISCNKSLLQSLHKKLPFLMDLLDENRMDGVEAIQNLETKLKNVAFRIEDEIELQLVHLYGNTDEESAHHCQRLHQILHPLTGKSHPCLKFRRILQRAKGDIDAIEEELVRVKMEYNHFIALQGRKTALDVLMKPNEVIMMGARDSSQHASHPYEDIMVGKNNEFQNLKKMLIQHPSRQLEIASITGMGGIGKTTLAKRVYEDPSIVSHFDERAWVIVSQNHNKRQMLVGLLKSMGKRETGSDEELALRLYQSLKSQRYMIVIDDLWSKEAWDVVKSCFPNDVNGSRVVLTTRLVDVAKYICSNNDFLYEMQLLDQVESWNVFRRKASKCYGAEFEAIGRQVVEKCKGLPLAIVVVAGLFSKLNTLNEWKSVVEALNSFSTTTIDEECSRILSSSYNHLPYNLKACFLYLSIFPEDGEIHVNSLIRLWAAEGLLKACENMSLDTVAERHIQELKDRNLILVCQPSSCGRKIKAFRMHDLLHSFCVKEAKKENLLQVVYENWSNSSPKGFRWVSIQSEKFKKHTLHSSLKNCRSIFLFSGLATYSNLKFCNLLRVMYNIKCKIENLVHLRFLFSPLSDFSILKPFHSWNLQSLSIHKVYEMSFLEFPQLQHFNCNTTPNDFPIFFHQNLKNISWLLSYQCTKELFANIPYLTEVKIRSEGVGWNDCIYKNLAYLHQLQSLHLLSGAYWYAKVPLGMLPNNNHIVSLKNLKKLILNSMTFEGKEINILSRLPKLEVLKLLSCEYIGEEWKLPEEESFGKLIYLKIFETNLKRWEASAYHFPKLERLILVWCDELEEIPVEFAEILVLKSIELVHCLSSAVASAKQIQDEQHDQGNDNMIVLEKYTIEPGSESSDEVEFDEPEPYSNIRKRPDTEEDEYSFGALEE